MSADILRRLKGSISEVAEDLQLKIHIAVLKHEWQIGQVSTNHITPFQLVPFVLVRVLEKKMAILYLFSINGNYSRTYSCIQHTLFVF